MLVLVPGYYLSYRGENPSKGVLVVPYPSRWDVVKDHFFSPLLLDYSTKKWHELPVIPA